jgi:hypothetical protein
VTPSLKGTEVWPVEAGPDQPIHRCKKKGLVAPINSYLCPIRILLMMGGIVFALMTKSLFVGFFLGVDRLFVRGIFIR